MQLIYGLLWWLPLSAAGDAAFRAAHRPWVPRFLSPQEYSFAICNDGSPAAYYHRIGMPGSRRWLIYLDGVGWCWDAASCAHPWQRTHGTSREFPRTVQELLPRATQFLNFGIFDPVKSPLADAHVAFIKSCSNDAFMGDKGAVASLELPFEQRQPENGWHFRGRRIVEAVFADLRKHTGLGSQMGDRVVYGGCSAGARGAIATIDYIAGSESIVGKAGVVGLLDSGFWVPISPDTSSADWDSFGHQLREAMTLMNASMIVGEECARKYVQKEQWKCLMGAYRLPFVRTPYFLVHSLYDRFALTMNLYGGWRFEPVHSEDLPWAEKYRQMVLRYLPAPENGTGSVIFAPACYHHCVITKPLYWTTKANAEKLSDTLEQWLIAPYTSKRIWERCSGFNCGGATSLQVRKLQAADPFTLTHESTAQFSV